MEIIPANAAVDTNVQASPLPEKPDYAQGVLSHAVRLRSHARASASGGATEVSSACNGVMEASRAYNGSLPVATKAVKAWFGATLGGEPDGRVPVISMW